jgi:hypothetical protein
MKGSWTLSAGSRSASINGVPSVRFGLNSRVEFSVISDVYAEKSGAALEPVRSDTNHSVKFVLNAIFIDENSDAIVLPIGTESFLEHPTEEGGAPVPGFLPFPYPDAPERIGCTNPNRGANEKLYAFFQGRHILGICGMACFFCGAPLGDFASHDPARRAIG